MDFLDFIYHHQWIAYLPGVILLVGGLLRLCAEADKNDDEPKENQDPSRVVVTQRVPDPFEAFSKNKSRK